MEKSATLNGYGIIIDHLNLVIPFKLLPKNDAIIDNKKFIYSNMPFNV